MDLIKILCSLQLAEFMYRRLPKAAVHSKQSPIVKKYWTKAGEMTGKEMTTALTKSVFASVHVAIFVYCSFVIIWVGAVIVSVTLINLLKEFIVR